MSRLLAGKVEPVKQVQPNYRVVVVGGGSAGMTVAAQLLRKLPRGAGQVAVIEPRDRHFYQPYWTMVGGLGLNVKDSARPMGEVLPPGVEWIKESCAHFEPGSSSITLSSGQSIHYDMLIVAAGLQQNFDMVPGLTETLGKNGVSSIYSWQYSPAVWQNIMATKSGTAIFTCPATAINCGGAPQKIMYLADCAWQKQGVRGSISIEYHTGSAGIFGCAHYREELEAIMKRRNISANVKSNLVQVDGPNKLAIFRLDSGELITRSFDFLHVTPPMSAPDFVKHSPLVNSAGYVDVDQGTCQHLRYPNIFALGDCSSLPTSKTYSAITAQAPVVVHNVVAMVTGRPSDANAVYDGYTACPILLGGNRLMLAEFNGYTMDPSPTFAPLDQRKPSFIFYLMKRYIFEQAYWHLAPIGRWFGKHTVFELPLKKRTHVAAGVPEPASLEDSGSKAVGTESTAVNAKLLGVETPLLPGDISLSGSMPREAVEQLAPGYKSWLYLNPAENCAFHKAVIEAAGCQVLVVPLPSGVAGQAIPTQQHAAALLAALESMPRPVMVQCSTGNRAGAALMLWLAKSKGHNVKSAEQLAQDLDLKFFTRCPECGPVRDWLMQQLPVCNEDARPGPVPAGRDGYVLEQLFEPESSTFTYLLGCKDTSEAVLIDPVLGMQERDLALAAERGLTVKYVVNTHCHADHITSGSVIRSLRADVKTVISEASGAAADIKIGDGDVLRFGRFHLEALATPGHTDGCMSFVLKGPGQPKAVFTGDTVLIRGCGRVDFQQGCADRLYDSVHNRIFTLPGNTEIYPGHDYKGRNMSTVSEERSFNPRLAKTKLEFCQIMAELKLPLPKKMAVAVPANLVCGAQ